MFRSRYEQRLTVDDSGSNCECKHVSFRPSALGKSRHTCDSDDSLLLGSKRTRKRIHRSLGARIGSPSSDTLCSSSRRDENDPPRQRCVLPSFDEVEGRQSVRDDGNEGEVVYFEKLPVLLQSRGRVHRGGRTEWRKCRGVHCEIDEMRMDFWRIKGSQLANESVDLAELGESEIDDAFIVGFGSDVAFAEEERVGVSLLERFELRSGRSGKSDYTSVVAKEVVTVGRSGESLRGLGKEMAHYRIDKPIPREAP